MGNGQPSVALATGSLLALFLLCPALARAHTLNLFVQRVEGAAIHGHAFFPNDVAAQNCDVIAHDASDRELGRTKTDENGNFTFTARKRVDHFLVAETTDGHRSRPYPIRASVLPDSLPADSGGPPIASPKKGQSAVPVSSAGKENESAAVKEQLVVLGNQLDMLRQQVYESDERLRFRDILGGIGFILGISGVAYYMKARRRHNL